MSTPLRPEATTISTDLQEAGSAIVRVLQAQAYACQVPRASSSSGLTNYVVVLKATTDSGRQIDGLGEGQPRSWRTGDDAGSAWSFLSAALEEVTDFVLPTSDVGASLSAVRTQMATLQGIADMHATVPKHKHPFRGTLLGLETAMLDLVGKIHKMSIGEILGAVRQTAAIAPPALLVSDGPGEVERKLNKQAGNYDMVRVLGDEVIPKNIRFLELVMMINQAQKGAAPLQKILIDLNGALNRKEAAEFIQEIADSISRETLPPSIIVEQPVPLKYGDYLPILQQQADTALERPGKTHAEILVVGDESVWDEKSVDRLRKLGGIRAINVRPAQAGGLLASMDLVSRVMRATPEPFVVLTRMPGASDLSAHAIDHLAQAMPQIDAVNSRASFVLSDANAENIGGEGLGLRMSYQALMPQVRDVVTSPAIPEPTYEGFPANVYEDTDSLHTLGPRGSKGHLAEREALALGLSTTRFSKGVFTATDGVHNPVIFKWNRNPLVSAVALGLSTHKEATRLQLQRAQVPVPRGRTFLKGDFENAKKFAKHIGYPVVLKPAMGVRGIGVVANIENEQGLEDAYQLMTSSRLGHQDFIVEKHINGRDYRIVVVGDEVVAAILREPASVEGDGIHSVAELLLIRNKVRNRNPHLWARPPLYNDAMRYELEKVGLTIDSIPEAGQKVRLGSTNSLSQGGESFAVLEDMHPSIRDACVKVVRAIPGMDYCGVDFLLEDHTKPLSEQDAGVCELNAHAAIGNCQYPMFGVPQPVARLVMQEVSRRMGLDVASVPADKVCLHVKVHGRVTGVGYRAWLSRRAEKAGVTGWVRNVNQRTVELVVQGSTEKATAVVSSLINGPKRSLPTSYTAVHTDCAEIDGFEILHDKSSKYDQAEATR